MMMTPEALLAKITYMAHNNPSKTAIADSKGDYSYVMLYDAVKGYRCDGPIDIIEGERSFDTVSRMIGAYCNSIPYVCMEEKMPDSFREDLLKGVSMTVPDDVAYVTYTSGTTGKAKGIAIRRKSLGLFVEAFVKERLDKNEKKKKKKLTGSVFRSCAFSLFAVVCTCGGGRSCTGSAGERTGV